MLRVTYSKNGSTLVCSDALHVVKELNNNFDLGLSEARPFATVSTLVSSGTITVEQIEEGGFPFPASAPVIPSQPIIVPVVSSVPSPAVSASASDKGSKLVELIRELSSSINEQQPINEARIVEIVRSEVSKIETGYKGITVKVGELPEVSKDGLFHCQFTDLLAYVVNDVPVFLTGDMGGGKTKAAVQVAESLGLPCFIQSTSSQTTVSSLLGYNDANGVYCESPLFTCYSGGGVYVMDEVDNGNANTLNIYNGVLDGDFFGFPCGQVSKHKDFKVIATANTVGNGATVQFNGRMKLDEAFKNRFGFLEWVYDESLELALSPCVDFTKKVQQLRKVVNSLNMGVSISPRVSLLGGRMVNAGMLSSVALQSFVYSKLSASQVELIKSKF